MVQRRLPRDGPLHLHEQLWRAHGAGGGERDGRRNIVAAENLLEGTAGLLCPPFLPATSRCGSLLLLSASANVRAADDVIALEGVELERTVLVRGQHNQHQRTDYQHGRQVEIVP